MSEPTGKLFGLLDNGKAEWARWTLAMALGAGVNWGVTEYRLDAIERDQIRQEARQSAALTDAISAMREDVRELRGLFFQVGTSPGSSERRREGDDTPAFPRDERFGVGQ